MGRVRAAVYNRYWPTGGGGEAYGAGVAYVLRQRAEVDLLCHDPVDVEWLAERLRIDLDGVTARVIADRPGSVTAAARDYDLFVNVSYMSGDLAPSPQSLYVVHFPNPPELGLSKPRKAVIRGLRAVGQMPPAVEHLDGFFDRDPGALGVRWTTGAGRVRITLPPGAGPTPVTFRFGAGRPEPTVVSLAVDGHVVSEVEVGGPSGGRLDAVRGTRAHVVLTGEGPSNEQTVTILSDTFVPADLAGADRRALGVPLRGVQVGRSLTAAAETWLPWLGTRGTPSDWQLSYGALVANSAFTASWVKRWWSLDSQVLYPPVSMQERGVKGPQILNVGRFFAAEQGHSKKQLELVRAFRALVDGGLRGWTLHLVGGCEAVGRPYLEQVQGAAAGYPVEFHVDASGEELAALYAGASVYWHASGMGESPTRHPGRLEHFGMTTVEAMSAGAVPVVIGLAGQTETVRHGVDGFHIANIRELAELTRLLIDDEHLREEMSRRAEQRARQYSLEAFGHRFWDLVEALPDVEGAGHYGPSAS
ncbi:MAG: glycosyltransferase [Acidimicrobiales bacterium]